MPPQVVSVSIEEGVLAHAKQRALRLGYKSFSAYCERVFRADVSGQQAHVLHETSAPVSSATPSVAPGTAGTVAEELLGLLTAEVIQRRADRSKAAASRKSPASARRAAKRANTP